MTDEKAMTAVNYSGLWVRLGAFVIDVILISLIALPLWVWFFLSVRVGPTVQTGLEFFVVFLIWYIISLFYFIGFWAWCGQTPGKLLSKIKVISQDRSKIGLGKSILRYLIGYSIHYLFTAVLFVPVIALLAVIAIHKRKRGVHDLIASTCVIRTP
jgi:uncharacterized RDD family membrane protein YckC